MKKHFNYILLLALFASTLSCGKGFLEVEPKGSLIATKTAEYENMFYNSQSVGFDAPALILGDDATVLDSYFAASPITLQRFFRYQADVYEPEASADELIIPIRNIYLYNKIINEVMNSEGGTLESKNSIQAEAKASRAFLNLYLINYYGKPYQTSSASTDPGVPLVTKADVAQNSFTRATVQQVYDNMISDLKESIPLIPINVPNRLRMCKSAAELTLAKIYWFMGNYDQALLLIKQAKSHMPTSFESFIYNYNQTYASGTWTVTSAIENRQSLFARTSTSFMTNNSNDMLLAPWVSKLYSKNDQRLKSFSGRPYLGTSAFPVENLSRRIGPFGAQAPQGIYLPDVELMQAECEARAGNIEAATSIVTSFREKRMPADEAKVAVIEKNGLIRFIVEERVREFALYGWRWFDMRRLSNDPLFKDQVYEHKIYGAKEGKDIETIKLPTERLTLRFPIGVISRNPGMENNP
ncbi:RagB/SusD family nutrient uptake outer membrane protein [Sphingobacterium detergens]|uniref:RagB/SusD family nutrient uptake outer membrane protein n=1 Tax=Sphingobacterium detergens TaxID=1145106 RepID=UPI003AAA28D1